MYYFIKCLEESDCEARISVILLFFRDGPVPGGRLRGNAALLEDSVDVLAPVASGGRGVSGPAGARPSRRRAAGRANGLVALRRGVIMNPDKRSGALCLRPRGGAV